MLKQTALEHYKSAANIARALDISAAAVSKWGPIVPKFSAEELQRLTKRKLRVINSMYVRGRPNLAALSCSPSHAL